MCRQWLGLTGRWLVITWLGQVQLSAQWFWQTPQLLLFPLNSNPLLHMASILNNFSKLIRMVPIPVDRLWLQICCSQLKALTNWEITSNISLFIPETSKTNQAWPSKKISPRASAKSYSKSTSPSIETYHRDSTRLNPVKSNRTHK